MASTKSNQVTPRANVITDDDLAAIQTASDLLTLFKERGVDVDRVEDYVGTGFQLVKKNTLVGVDLVLIQWKFRESEEYSKSDGTPSEYVIVEALTANNEKVVFVDGSTGVCKQLATITAERIARGSKTPTQGLLVEGGLTRSDYPATDTRPAGTTYYLAN